MAKLRAVGRPQLLDEKTNFADASFNNFPMYTMLEGFIQSKNEWCRETAYWNPNHTLVRAINLGLSGKYSLKEHLQANWLYNGALFMYLL